MDHDERIQGAELPARSADDQPRESLPLHHLLFGLVALPLKGTFWHFPAGLAYRKSLALPHALSAVIAIVKARMGELTLPPDSGN